MGEKGIDPGVAQPNPGMGMAAMPGIGGLAQKMGEGPIERATNDTQGAPPPQQPHGQPDPVAEVVGDILDPLGLHKLF
jgi:hypothetical protein